MTKTENTLIMRTILPPRDSCRSRGSSGGGTLGLSSCAAVQLSLDQPLDRYRVLVQQDVPSYEQQEQFCELSAQLLQHPTAEQLGACNTLALEVPGKGASSEQRRAHWLHLHSSCSNVSATLRVRQHLTNTASFMHANYSPGC